MFTFTVPLSFVILKTAIEIDIGITCSVKQLPKLIQKWTSKSLLSSISLEMWYLSCSLRQFKAKHIPKCLTVLEEDAQGHALRFWNCFVSDMGWLLATETSNCFWIIVSCHSKLQLYHNTNARYRITLHHSITPPAPQARKISNFGNWKNWKVNGAL